MSEEYDWMEESRMLAAECWRDHETSGIDLDATLCEAVAKRIAVWMLTAAQNQRNTDYYKGLLEQCGIAIGDRAYTADDGTRMEDVLCAKIPEIIARDYANGIGTTEKPCTCPGGKGCWARTEGFCFHDGKGGEL